MPQLLSNIIGSAFFPFQTVLVTLFRTSLQHRPCALSSLLRGWVSPPYPHFAPPFPIPSDIVFTAAFSCGRSAHHTFFPLFCSGPFLISSMFFLLDARLRSLLSDLCILFFLLWLSRLHDFRKRIYSFFVIFKMSLITGSPDSIFLS